MDRYRQHMLDVARQIAAADSDDIIELACIGGRDPRTVFRGGDWSGADFRGRDLRGYDFRDCCLTGARFQGALVADAMFDDVIGADLRGAVGAAPPQRAQSEAKAPSAQRPVSDTLRFGVVETLWSGLLQALTPQLAVAGAPLGSGVPRNVGLSGPLAEFFDAETRARDIGWAAGPLRVMAVHDQAGVIRSIRTAVTVDPKGAGDSPILIVLSDAEGHAEHLALTHDYPAATCLSPALRGPIAAMSLALSVLKSQ